MFEQAFRNIDDILRKLLGLRAEAQLVDVVDDLALVVATSIYALLVYGKNERADLTAEQRRAVAAFAAAIKATRKRR